MRLSEWAARAPHRDAMSPKVLAVVRPVLAALGVDADPETFIVWADDPDRYFLLAIAPAGLVTCHVRVNAPQEGPRAAGRLIRWGRLQVGELAVETQGSHRLLTVQVDQQVLRGVDDDCDAISSFVNRLFAAQDGRADVPREGDGTRP